MSGTRSGPPRADELARIRAAALLATTGQQALRASLAPGVRESELLAEVLATIDGGDGDRARTLTDLLSGERTSLIDGRATDRVIESGEPVLFDLALERGGYWADSCSTVCCGSAGAELGRRHLAVSRALEAGIAAARAGVAAGRVDSAIRAVLSDAGFTCPHHTGHGVGREAQQAPYLVPGEETELEDGIVLAIEPGVYGEGLGVRLEHLVVVGPDGASPLTEHRLSLN